jgi:uncharacterized protein (TIGR00369 family)
MNDDTVNIPDGFRPMKLAPNPFIELVGPLYGRVDDGALTVGFPVRARSCNPAGMCHGGMLCTLADLTLILCSNVQTGMGRYFTTVSLNTDFLAPAPRGSWIEGRAQVLRVTRSLVFTQGVLSVDGAPVLRANAIFKPIGEASAEFSVARYFD